MSEFLVFENISKSFGKVKVLDNISLAIEKGEVFSLLGPSGCGKTTLLRICAGFVQPDCGRVLLNGKDITHLPSEKRSVNTVFQNYALFPHMTVRQNIAFGPKLAKRSKSQINNDVDKFLDLIQMSEYADNLTSELSGGQKQRVAIARALINQPEVLLLDEPLAALDLKLRQRMLVELDNLHDQVGTTFLYVTHDQGEAMSLSDHLAIMNAGQIEQKGTAVEVYEEPKSSFVAAFIGDTNFFDGSIKKIENEISTIEIVGLGEIKAYNDKKLKPKDAVHLSIRPEKLSASKKYPDKTKDLNILKGVVEELIYMGNHTKCWVKVEEQRIFVRLLHTHFMTEEDFITWGDEVYVYWNLDDGYMLECYDQKDEALLILSDEEIIENSNNEIEAQYDENQF